MLCAVQIAYFAVGVTRGGQDPDHAVLPHLVRLLTDQLGQGRQRGRVPAHLDAGLEADALATTTAGLLSAVLVDAYDTEQATRIIDDRLGHLFPDWRSPRFGTL